MNAKQPETLRIADDLRHSIAHYGREDAFTLNAYDAEKRLRSLYAENETLRAGYAAARLEIASLHAQMDAVGAGGVQPLRPVSEDEKARHLRWLNEISKSGAPSGCLHQIREPAQAEPDHPALLAAAQAYIAASQRMDSAMLDGFNVHGAMSGIIGATDSLRAAITAQQGGTNG